MHATANPLRKPQPARDECTLRGRFYFTDEQGRLASSMGTNVCLTAEDLWIAPELSVPLGQIEALQLVTKGALPPRRFLRIDYRNPVTQAREAVCLCKPDPIGIGFYRVGPLEDLVSRIEALRGQGHLAASLGAGPAGDAALHAGPSLDRCEVCGAQPAFYVGYLFLVSAVLLSYRSAVKRRIHCRKHNAVHGLGYYLLTVLTGWIGIGIFAYPFAVYAAARNLAPALGRSAGVLGLLPPLGLAALVVRWLV